MASTTQRQRPTLIGFTAILMWATLALLTDLSGDVPPFQLTAMAFTLAFGVGVGMKLRGGNKLLDDLKLPGAVWAIGVIGLFGFHFFYFMAIQNAPVVEASLIAYLWPLLIVFFSALLPGERLRWFHGAGAIAGFIGSGVLITKGQGLALNSRHLTGYLAAFVCALTWSSYSLLSRRFGAIPTSAVGSFCGATAILAWICHLVFEPTVWPMGGQWIAIVGLGLGPVGLAFFTWDYGVKHGNIRLLGTLSYGAPLLSTLLLIACGLADATETIIVACLLIVGGALLAALDSFLPNI